MRGAGEMCQRQFDMEHRGIVGRVACNVEGVIRTCGWGGMAPGSDAVEHGWINIVRKGWSIKQDT